MELATVALILLVPSRAASDVVLIATVWIALSCSSSTRTRLSLSTLDDLPRLVVAIAAAQGFTYWTLAFVGAAPTPRDLFFGGALVLAAVLMGRLLGYMLVNSQRKSGFFSENAVVVGQGRSADFLLSRLREHREFGLRPVGHVQTSNGVVQDPRELTKAIHQMPNVRAVILTETVMPDDQVVAAVRSLISGGLTVYYVPRFSEFAPAGDASDSIWGMPLIRVRPPGGATQRTAKRSFDIAVSFVALALLAPLMLLVGCGIRRETGGSVLFRQTRVGERGKPFELLKFQTMVPVDDQESQTQWSIATDARVGRFGKFLRATSVDELPQLVNILRGDMSLVGPRPERPHYVDEFSARYAHYADRHRAPVGLTGWAQIHRLRGDTSIDDRARFDNAYCDHWDLWDDAKIILKTIPEVVRHSGG